MTEMEKKMLQQREEIKDLRIKSELQINAITVNYEQRLDKLREAIGWKIKIDLKSSLAL